MNSKDYLKNLVKEGFLKQEEVGNDQIKALLKSASRNLSAAKKNLEIDEETCYIMAYNSMLKISRALLFLQGFRPVGNQQHKTTIEAAGKILGKEFSDLIDKFDNMRKKRNILIYDPLMPLSHKEARGALEAIESFYKKVQIFLKKTNLQTGLL